MKFLPLVAILCISLTIAKSPSQKYLDKGFKETVIKDTKDTGKDMRKKADSKIVEVHTFTFSKLLIRHKATAVSEHES